MTTQPTPDATAAPAAPIVTRSVSKEPQEPIVSQTPPVDSQLPPIDSPNEPSAAPAGESVPASLVLEVDQDATLIANPTNESTTLPPTDSSLPTYFWP